MRTLWLFMVPFFAFSAVLDLQTLIEATKKNNQKIEAKTHQIESKEAEVESLKAVFWPTVDVGISDTFVSPKSLVSPGETAMGFIKLGMRIYDGGRRAAELRAKKLEYKAATYEKQAFEKSVVLGMVQHFYTLKKYYAELEVLEQKSKELQTQMERIMKFEASGLVVQDEIDKFQAEYDENSYQIEAIKLASESERQYLMLQSQIEFMQIAENYFQEPHGETLEYSENVKMMESSAKAIQESADAVGLSYMPQFHLENTYTKSKYNDRVNSAFGDDILLDHQNILRLSLTMRLFDGAQKRREKESLQYQKMVLESEKNYAIEEQKIYFILAKRRLKTLQAQIKSAKSGLRASRNSHQSTLQKYQEGVVDYITYIETLTQETTALSRLKEATFDYEIAKALYYYYAGKDPKEYLK